MSLPEFHKMCDSLGFFELSARDNVNNVVEEEEEYEEEKNGSSRRSQLRVGTSWKKEKTKLTDEKLDHMFNNLISRRDLRQQHSQGNRRSGRST
jgi:hypothetical protein